MKYNFDEIINRRNTNSVKWDLAPADNVLPMWVADMDFKAAPAITEALTRRVGHGIFGYSIIPAAYNEAVAGWWQRRFDFEVSKKWIVPVTGIIPALSAIVKAFTAPGDKVLVQAPVYNHFFDSIKNNGCTVVSNDLVYNNGVYSIDLADFEAKAADPAVRLFLLCNPHNPAGRVWTAQDLMAMGEICLKHNVVIVADEIHCDLVYPGHQHIPFASINQTFLQNSITCTSPTKTFNLAGMQVANLFIPSDKLRQKVSQAIAINEVGYINPFGIEALIAAYNEGEEWLEELKVYLYANYSYLKDFFYANLPQYTISPLEATYLVWVNCTAARQSSAELCSLFMEKEKLWINPGTMYGDAGEGFIRINIACPRPLLQESLERLLRTLSNL